MILVDISSVLHRMVFGSTLLPGLKKNENNEYITEDFIKLTLSYIMEELMNYQLQYREYGDLVICFDDYTKSYWRKDVYPGYKAQRKATRDASPVNYPEVYRYTNKLFEMIREHTPWKCVYVNRAEADDIILVLAKEYYNNGILICSPDKDFIQCQRLPNIKQYSSMTKKWIVPENKHTDMEQWINEHVMLGDNSDGVPKVVDHVEFSDPFITYITGLNPKDFPELAHLNEIPTDVYEFSNLTNSQKSAIIDGYNIRSCNRKGDECGLDIFKTTNFGPSSIERIHNGTWALNIKVQQLKESKKELKQKFKETKDEAVKQQLDEIDNFLKNPTVDNKTTHERLDEFLDSNPLYRKHYNRNYTLVMEEGIPDYIRINILQEYKNASTTYNMKEFDDYLISNGLMNIQMALPKVFNSTETLTIGNCGW